MFHLLQMERALQIAFLFQIFCYLSIGCKYEKLGKQHTMCIYTARACPDCQLLHSGEISAEDQDLIVKIHNQIRSYLAIGNISGLPSSADMRVMSWDNELAAIAQRWADQCTNGHDQLRNTEQYYVGQNVARSWSYKYEDPEKKGNADWESSIELWSSEYQKFGFNPDHINPFKFSYEAGHFTQMIWGETHKIGCGYTYYKRPKQGYTKSYVCNYAPGGNIIQGAMYKISVGGARCSDPSLQPSKEHEGLCEIVVD